MRARAHTHASLCVYKWLMCLPVLPVSGNRSRPAIEMHVMPKYCILKWTRKRWGQRHLNFSENNERQMASRWVRQRWPGKGPVVGGKTRGRDYRDISFFLSTSYPTHAHCSTMGGLSIKLDKTGMTDQRWAENKGSRRRSKPIPERSRGSLDNG